MPSATAASAIAQLYKNDGAPWSWDTWKDITGVRHGLFPEDDAELPTGISRRDSNDISSYFTAYNALPSEGAKLRFAAGKDRSQVPGRKIWSDYVTKNYSKWGINGIVIQALNRANAHPVKQMLGENTLDDWPSADHLLPQALNDIGLALFGADAVHPETDNIRTFLRGPTQHIAQRTWSTIYKKFTRDRKTLGDNEQAAEAAFEGACVYTLHLRQLNHYILAAIHQGRPTKAKVVGALKLISKWKELADIFSTKDVQSRVETMLAEVAELINSMGGSIKQHGAGARRMSSAGRIIGKSDWSCHV
jgi:TATA-binding protein-associated factor